MSEKLKSNQNLFLYFNGFEIFCKPSQDEIFKGKEYINIDFNIFNFEEPDFYIIDLGYLKDIIKNFSNIILKTDFGDTKDGELMKINNEIFNNYFDRVLFNSFENLLFNLQIYLKKYLIQKFNDKNILNNIINIYKNKFDKNKYKFDNNVENLSKFSINELKEKLLNSINKDLDTSINHNFHYLSSFDFIKESLADENSPGLICDIPLYFKNLNICINIYICISKINLLNKNSEYPNVDIEIDFNNF